MIVYDYTHHNFRENKFCFVLTKQNTIQSYRYYKKLSVKIIIKYLNMEWEYNVDIEHLIRDIKELNLMTPEVELAVKLR